MNGDNAPVGAVKPLEWRKSNVADRWVASHPWGEVVIIRDSRSDEYGWFNGGGWFWYKTLDEAQRRAQETHAQRILSEVETLYPHPPQHMQTELSGRSASNTGGVENGVEEVSDGRLAEMLAAIPRYADGKVRSSGWVGRVPAPELEALLVELQSRRAANRTGGVAVKAIHWGETSYGTPEAITVVGVYRINSGWSGGWSVVIKDKLLKTDDGRENFPTIEAAKAAAQQDFNTRVLSCLAPHPSSPVSAEVTEPVMEPSP